MSVPVPFFVFFPVSCEWVYKGEVESNEMMKENADFVPSVGVKISSE